MLFIFIGLTLLIGGHLLGYPWWMRWRSRQHSHHWQQPEQPEHPAGRQQPTAVTVLVPCYNEAPLLAQKLTNLLLLERSGLALTVRVVLDGCQDNGAAVARTFRQRYRQQGIRLQLFAHRHNLGKCARLNQHLPQLQAQSAWWLLSDCSALLCPQALILVQSHFRQPSVGAVTGVYEHQADKRLQAHWQRLNQIRAGEGVSGCLMGGTGAALALRSARLKPLSEGCVNDDFELVMQVLAQGHQAHFEPRLLAQDCAPQFTEKLFSQRCRIASGNVQQLPMLWRGIRWRKPHEWLMAALGKGMGAILPLLLLLWLLSGFGVLWQWPSPWGPLLAGGSAALVVLGMLLPHWGWQHPYAARSLALQGAFVGMCLGFIGQRSRWHRDTEPQGSAFQPWPVRLSKRGLDIIAASCGLVLLLPLLPWVALAIKLDSAGPIFYRQLRIGARHPNYTELLFITKFRTMYTNAEQQGAQWASKSDPRITRVGRYLRATRLDELPQLWQVLWGSLSLVGPRPERPQFCGELERQLPFYLERTYGLRPGLTGLAQVHQAGDTCLADVQNKLLYDHAYAAALAHLGSYIRMESHILWRTIWVMLAAKGH